MGGCRRRKKKRKVFVVGGQATDDRHLKSPSPLYLVVFVFPRHRRRATPRPVVFGPPVCYVSSVATSSYATLRTSTRVHTWCRHLRRHQSRFEAQFASCWDSEGKLTPSVCLSSSPQRKYERSYLVLVLRSTSYSTVRILILMIKKNNRTSRPCDGDETTTTKHERRRSAKQTYLHIVLRLFCCCYYYSTNNERR